MKKILALFLALVMLLSLAACQSGGGTAESTEPSTEPSTEATEPSEDIIVTEPSTEATEATTEEPTEPPAPTELNASGYCAVGVVDEAAGTAKVLGDNGAIVEISFTGSNVHPGMVYAYAKNGDAYTLTEIAWINGNEHAWAVQTIDNAYDDTLPDQLLTNDGTNTVIYDLTEDCVIFLRFSDTEYRIFRGNEAIYYSTFPCGCYFYVEPDPNGGNLQVPVMLVCSVDINTWVDGDCDEANSYIFDVDNIGWADGDLVIE